MHYSLNKNHPYVDGNKRLAVTAMEWFLFRNGFVMMTSNDRLVNFALQVADNTMTQTDSAVWVSRRAFRVTWSDERHRRWLDSLSAEEYREVREARDEAASTGAMTPFMQVIAGRFDEEARSD